MLFADLRHPIRPSARPVPRTAAPLAPPLPAATWALLRRQLQRRLEAHVALRTLALGPAMRLRFDDELTLRLELQDELLDGRPLAPARLARLVDALPGDDEWRATLTVAAPGSPSPSVRPRFLDEAAALVHVQVGIERLASHDPADTAGARALDAPRGLRFALTPGMRDALDAGASATLVCTHPRYAWRRRLPAVLLRELRRGLAGHREAPR